MIIMIAYSSNIDYTVVFLREHELRVGTIISLLLRYNETFLLWCYFFMCN